MNLIKIFRCNFSATEIEMFFNAKDADGDGVISAKVFQQGRVFQIVLFCWKYENCHDNLEPFT